MKQASAVLQRACPLQVNTGAIAHRQTWLCARPLALG